MVVVRFGLVCVVLGLAGRGDQNTPYRFSYADHGNDKNQGFAKESTIFSVRDFMSLVE
jgi:hypothetical protein